MCILAVLLVACAAAMLSHGSAVHAAASHRTLAAGVPAAAIAGGTPRGALPRDCSPDPAETIDDDDVRDGERLDAPPVDGGGGRSANRTFGPRRRHTRALDACTPAVQRQVQAIRRAARQRRVPATQRRHRRAIRGASRGTGDRAAGPHSLKSSASARAGADAAGAIAPLPLPHTLTRNSTIGGCRGHPADA